jgi:ectoine hydroxylase-related dioxygenase (phytanoyl-CoA dioxygenase family)
MAGMPATAAPVLPSAERESYLRDGFVVRRGLFNATEVTAIADHFMRMRAEGPKPGDMGGDPSRGESDPLNRYARMINMHGWDAKTDAWRADRRLVDTAEALAGEAMALCQTMLYFKPPGGRGQGLHQDNQYIREAPLVGCWLALDRSDEANGCMLLAPGSHRLGIQPVEPADPALSFTNGQTVLPAGTQAVSVVMEAGDVLFFDGFTIHGSLPNRTPDRFRRCFIVHYLAKSPRRLPEDPTTSMAALEQRRRQGV